MDHQLAPDLKELLGQTRLRDLLARRDKPLVSVAHTEDVGTVLELLSQHSILSAPVFVTDAQGNTNPSVNSLIGFVDVWTVLSAFLQSLPAAAGAHMVFWQWHQAAGDTTPEQLFKVKQNSPLTN